LYLNAVHLLKCDKLESCPCQIFNWKLCGNLQHHLQQYTQQVEMLLLQDDV
jgi:hypothetical protein